jgi:hypothetical protein
MRNEWLRHNLIAVGTIILVVPVLFAFAQINGRHPSVTGVALSFDFPEQRLTLHEPVILTFKVTNNAPGAIKLFLGEDRKAGFSFTLMKPDGTTVKLPPYRPEGLSVSGDLSVQPGESYFQNLLLNEWYDFASLGTYELDARLVQPILADSGVSYGGNAGLSARIEITPRDELTLSKTCDNLASAVEGATSASQEAVESALALSYIRDPIAVPYLRRVLKGQRMVENFAIKGLEAIANESAVQALIEGSKMEYADSAVLSRSALARIRDRTRDPLLREDIDSALK